DGLELRRRVDGEAGLDDVDAQVGELGADLDLLLGGEVDPRGLLAVSQGGVEDSYVVWHGCRSPPSDGHPSDSAPPCGPESLPCGSARGPYRMSSFPSGEGPDRPEKRRPRVVIAAYASALSRAAP